MGNTIKLTESELINLVKKIVNEGAAETQQVKPERWQQFVVAVRLHLDQLKGNPQYADMIVKAIMKDCTDFLNKKEIKIVRH
jgi:hypothetical protein